MTTHFILWSEHSEMWWEGISLQIGFQCSIKFDNFFLYQMSLQESYNDSKTIMADVISCLLLLQKAQMLQTSAWLSFYSWIFTLLNLFDTPNWSVSLAHWLWNNVPLQTNPIIQCSPCYKSWKWIPFDHFLVHPFTSQSAWWLFVALKCLVVWTLSSRKQIKKTTIVVSNQSQNQKMIMNLILADVSVINATISISSTHSTPNFPPFHLN